MKGLSFSGRIDENGVITLPKTMRKQMIAAFKGKPIEVTVKRRSAKHSDAQRGYYWACVIPALVHGFNDLGTPMQPGNKDHLETVHEFCKAQFLKGREVFTATGEAIYFPASTSDLNKDDFGRYIDEIARWAAEYLNINIPAPGEQVSIF